MKQILLVVLCSILGAPACVASQSGPATDRDANDAQAKHSDGASTSQLRFAIVLSRHGVRSPTWTNARLDEYSAQQWPPWPVAPGLLTPHGKRLMTLFGGYDRSYFAEQGLLSRTGCADSSHIFIDADSDERTVESGRGLADGIAPGCGVRVLTLAVGTRDALFHPLGGSAAFDPELASAALSGRIGDNPGALRSAYLGPLQQMQQVLSPCSQQPCTTAPAKKSLLAIKPSVAPGNGDHLIELKGPLTTAATLAEDLQLEYLEGMPDAQLGWGRVDEDAMRELMILHAASSDLIQRTPYIAHAQGANLLFHIERTLEQAQQLKQIDGAIGTTSDKLVYLVGHDTNIANIGALLDAHWLIDGYPRDDAAPGGALVLELWHNQGGEDTVRVYYMVQTPVQMREELPLSLAKPPARAKVFLPGCSGADQNASCDWKDFEVLLKSKF